MHIDKCLTFLLGNGKTASGYTFDQLHKWSDDDWENHHDFIQWLFPLNEPSVHNPNGPVLDAEAYDTIKNTPNLLNAIRSNYDRFLSYAGVQRTDDGLEFKNYSKEFWEVPNHNWLRITRVLKSLNLCGLSDCSQEFWNFLQKLPIKGSTMAYWELAANPN